MFAAVTHNSTDICLELYVKGIYQDFVISLIKF